MNGSSARFLRLGVGLSALVILGWVLTGQAARSANHGIPLPTDWSHRHLIFSRPGTPEQLARVSRDPRYLQQVHRREQQLALPPSAVDIGDAGVFPQPGHGGGGGHKQLKGDWSEDLGSTGGAGAGNYPAKFSFSSTIANCGNVIAPAIPDYVVYSTGLTGAPGPSGQASVVAYDNLYSGCSGTKPSVYWAYNTGGKVLTSPVISIDGKQVAFVETSGGFGILVILKWAASPSDTITSPETLTVTAPGSYNACIAPCMTEILLKDGIGSQTDDISSSVYYDYADDVAWVGGALGWLHKINGMFNGTPAEVSNGTFPVHVSSTDTFLSSPIYDNASNNVFVGDDGGFLFSVNGTSGAVTTSGALDFGTGLVESPIVDSTNGFVYVFASSDGTLNCTASTSACSAVYQLSTTFTGGDTGNEITVGSSSAAPNSMYIGGFDSAYYNSLNATGNLYVCGNTGTNPTIYQIPFTAGAPPVSLAGNLLVALVSAGLVPACSSVTDELNPNQSVGAEERFFVSVTNKGTASGCSHAGCLFNFIDTPWRGSTTYQLGQEILDSNLNIQTVVTPGTSGSTAPLVWHSAGSTTTDGTVVWLGQGLMLANYNTWTHKPTPFTLGARVLDTNGNIEVCTTGGINGLSQPSSWNTTVGGTTADGAVIWTNDGASPTAAFHATGGTSGIIVDNVIGSGTFGGASQVYFTTLGNQLCTTSTGTGGCAIQASQPTLQ